MSSSRLSITGHQTFTPVKTVRIQTKDEVTDPRAALFLEEMSARKDYLLKRDKQKNVHKSPARPRDSSPPPASSSFPQIPPISPTFSRNDGSVSIFTQSTTNLTRSQVSSFGSPQAFSTTGTFTNDSSYLTAESSRLSGLKKKRVVLPVEIEAKVFVPVIFPHYEPKKKPMKYDKKITDRFAEVLHKSQVYGRVERPYLFSVLRKAGGMDLTPTTSTTTAATTTASQNQVHRQQQHQQHHHKQKQIRKSTSEGGGGGGGGSGGIGSGRSDEDDDDMDPELSGMTDAVRGKKIAFSVVSDSSSSSLYDSSPRDGFISPRAMSETLSTSTTDGFAHPIGHVRAAGAGAGAGATFGSPGRATTRAQPYTHAEMEALLSAVDQHNLMNQMRRKGASHPSLH